MKDKIRKLFCESPVIDNTHLAFSNKSGKSVGGRSNEEDVQVKHEQCKESWQHVKDDYLSDDSVIEWYRNGEDARGFVISTDEEIMGFIGGSLRKVNSKLPSYFKVHMVVVFDEYQNKGYGFALYKGAIDLFGGVVSDSTLTKSSLRMWEKLVTKYPVYKNNEKGIKLVKNVKAELGEYEEQFIATKKPIKI
jgi:GNAT superfamily N-acetyltransferase